MSCKDFARGEASDCLVSESCEGYENEASSVLPTGRFSGHPRLSQRLSQTSQAPCRIDSNLKSRSLRGTQGKMDVATTAEDGQRQEQSSTDTALHRLRGIKLRFSSHCQGDSQTRFIDERISMEEFEKSARVLDATCTSQPPLKIQRDAASSSGLVPFSVFQRAASDDRDEPEDRRHSITHLSFDEDNEEDMFAEAKDDAMETGGSACNKAEVEIMSSFLGFSTSECEHSRNVATRCCEHQELAKLGTGEPEKQVFKGFTRLEQDRSVDAIKMWYRWVNEYECQVATDIRTNGCPGKCPDQTNAAVDLPCIRQLKITELPKRSEKKQMNLESARASRSYTSKVDDRIDQHPPDNRQIVPPFDPGASKLVSSTGSCGFSTASGRKIVLSEAAISRAQKLYKQVELDLDDEIKSQIVGERRSENNASVVRQSSSSSTNFSGEEFQVAKTQASRGSSLFDESEDEIIESLIEPNRPVKSQSDEKLKEPNNFALVPTASQQYIPSGFRTARGGELKIPQEALSQAQAQYDEIQLELEDKARENRGVTSVTKDTKKDVGFTTAGGREIKISKEALTKAKAQFDEIASQLNEAVTPTSSPASSLGKGNKVTSGLRTAGEGQMKISKDAKARPEAHFDEISDELDGTLTPKNSRSGINEQVSSSGFITAAGRELKISKDALSKAKAQFLDLENELMENLSQISSKLDAPAVEIATSIGKGEPEARAPPLVEKNSTVDSPNFDTLEFEDLLMDEADEATKKRKFEDVDEDTPMRRDPAWKRKKGRYVSELQGRKLFDEDPAIVAIIDQPEMETAMHVETLPSVMERKTNHAPDEIDASAAALLEDEERYRQTMKIQPHCTTVDDEIEMDTEDNEENTKYLPNRSNPNLSSATKILATNFRPERKSSAEVNAESIPDDLTFDSQFSQDQHHSQVINKFIAETMKIMEARLAMTSKQDETIRSKRRSKPRASDGSLYLLRISNKDNRLSWRKLTEGKPPVPRDNFGVAVDSEVLTITANSAASYTFSCADFYGGRDVRINVEGIKVGDGAYLILDERNCAGAREFERAFLASPGVDPNLVPAGWLKNHYRWIVWKLASMDRVKFGQKCLPRMLTPHRVMLELKYRYDRELYRTQWPPLKRILEKNEDAGARLVLCVASITLEDDNKIPVVGSSNTPRAVGSTTYKMRLTDGWYDIAASVDHAMMNCIKSGRIKEGTKIVTFGAKAMNLDQGCSVLEIPECVTLRIHTNSTRRARWDTRLDFYRLNRGPMCLSLKSVKPNGGAICKLVVAVARSYPILYREKLPDGQFVFRNVRCDEEAARAHEARCQAKMEEICEKVQADFQFGSESGYHQEEEIRRAIASKLKECLPPPRDVTPVLKIRLAESDTSAIMTIWSAGRETDQVFEEGSSLVIYNCFAAGQRCNELQISAGRNAIFDREPSRRIAYPERVYTSLMDIGEAGFNPVYGEFDTVGIVSSIGPAPHGMKNFETVNLACPRSDGNETSDFLSVLFWQGVSTHGYSKILAAGALVACSNLEWRRNTSRSLPTAYCTERSVFTKNPRQKHLVKPFECVRELVKDPFTYAANCATFIREEVAKKTPLRTPGSGTACRAVTTTINTTPGWSPREPSCSSIDTNSTPKNNSRKASIMRRIEKLEVYGEPPKLPSISLNHSSPKVLSEFRSPVVIPVTKS